jgi:hypothetical protein
VIALACQLGASSRDILAIAVTKEHAGPVLVSTTIICQQPPHWHGKLICFPPLTVGTIISGQRKSGAINLDGLELSVELNHLLIKLRSFILLQVFLKLSNYLPCAVQLRCEVVD